MSHTSWMYPAVQAVTSQPINLVDPPLILEETATIIHTGDRILVRKQERQLENGIYEVVHEKLWVRASDFDHPRKIIPGALIYVVTSSSCWGFHIKTTKGAFPALEFFPYLMDHRWMDNHSSRLQWNDSTRCLVPTTTPTEGEYWERSQDTIQQYYYYQTTKKLKSKNIICLS